MIAKVQLEKMYLISWMVFVFVLPFSKAYPNLALIPILFLFIVLKKYKEVIVFTHLGFLCLVASIFWIGFTNSIQDGILESFSSLYKMFVLIAIFILVSTVKSEKDKILKAFIAGTFVQFIISLDGICTFYVENDFLNFATGYEINQILGAERPYLGFLMALSILFSLHIIQKNRNIWLYVWVSMALIFVFIISARLASGLCIVICIHHIYQKFKKHKLTVFSLSLLFVLGVIASLFFNKNFKNRMLLENDLNSSYAKFKSYEPRFIIWSCAYDFSQFMNPILGLGNHTEVENKLVACYVSKINPLQTDKIQFYEKEKFNTHNQYLEFLLLGGWLAFLLLILFFVFSIYNSTSTISSLTLFLFFLFFIFENVLYRQLGVHLMGVFLGLFISCQKVVPKANLYEKI